MRARPAHRVDHDPAVDAPWPMSHPQIGDIRGRGAMIAIELIHPGTTTPDPDLTQRIAKACHAQGVARAHRGHLRKRPAVPASFDDPRCTCSSRVLMCSKVRSERIPRHLHPRSGAAGALGWHLVAGDGERPLRCRQRHRHAHHPVAGAGINRIGGGCGVGGCDLLGSGGTRLALGRLGRRSTRAALRQHRLGSSLRRSLSLRFPSPPGCSAYRCPPSSRWR